MIVFLHLLRASNGCSFKIFIIRTFSRKMDYISSYMEKKVLIKQILSLLYHFVTKNNSKYKIRTASSISGIGRKIWPMIQFGTVYLFFKFTAPQLFPCYTSSTEQLQWRPYSLQSPIHVLTGNLQLKFADSSFI